jgi:hypothetical protein
LDADTGREGNDEFVFSDWSDFTNHRQNVCRLHPDQNRFRGASHFEVIGRDGDSSFGLDGGAQLVVGFTGDNLARRAKFRSEQPANDRAGQLPCADKTEAVRMSGCL